MKVSVCARVIYYYEVDLPEGKDPLIYCDSADPVYLNICNTLIDNHVEFEGTIVSIRNNDTDEELYVE